MGINSGLSCIYRVDYMLTKQLAIGANLSSIAGFVFSANKELNGRKTETYYADDFSSSIGLGQWRLTAGLRYYFQ